MGSHTAAGTKPREAKGEDVASMARAERSPGHRRPLSVRVMGSGDAIDRSALGHGERWYAVHCHACREAGARAHLANQGFRVFLPLRRKTWRHAHRIETRYVAFFSGYLFIALDVERHRWRSVNGTFGVRRLVTARGEARPVPLPAGLVEALLCKIDDRGCLIAGGPLAPGQKVQILSGPFGDRIGELIGLDDTGRVRVLIELLGGRVPAVLSRGEVMATR